MPNLTKTDSDTMKHLLFTQYTITRFLRQFRPDSFSRETIIHRTLQQVTNLTKKGSEIIYQRNVIWDTIYHEWNIFR